MRAWLCFVLCFMLFACTDVSIPLVNDPVVAGADAARHPALDAGSMPQGDATREAAASAPAAGAAAADRCGSRPCACNNGLDDDGDGLIDGMDPECTAAFDDDEASFATGLPNKLGGCRDCFWDDNTGRGNDDCRYPAECLVGEAPHNNGNCSSCRVSTQCVDECRVRTPNGCDCFGCCEVVGPSGEQVFVQLVESCQLARIGDAASCPRCVQDTVCAHPCGRCELCIGKTVDVLPADCRSDAGGAQYSCEQGQHACQSASDCRSSEYCLRGCCLVDVL